MSGSQKTLWDLERVSIPLKKSSPPKTHFPPRTEYRHSPTPNQLQGPLSNLFFILPLVPTLVFWPFTPWIWLCLGFIPHRTPSIWQSGFEMHKLVGRLIQDLNSALSHNQNSWLWLPDLLWPHCPPAKPLSPRPPLPSLEFKEGQD